MNDLVTCILHALENPKITGLEYSIRGSTSITFDGLLDLLSSHCNQPMYKKCRRSYITGSFEKFFIGRTHDKNFMKMAQWHEVERQNYLNDWDYMKQFEIKETTTLKEEYAEGKVNPEKYITPYLHQYKRISLE